MFISLDRNRLARITTFASFDQLFGRFKILHLYKIGSLTATEKVDRISAFSVIFLSSCRLTGSAQLKGGKIRRVGSHTWRHAYSGTACWLAGRQAGDENT